VTETIQHLRALLAAADSARYAIDASFRDESLELLAAAARTSLDPAIRDLAAFLNALEARHAQVRRAMTDRNE
jgi:hypothetical protein